MRFLAVVLVVLLAGCEVGRAPQPATPAPSPADAQPASDTDQEPEGEADPIPLSEPEEPAPAKDNADARARLLKFIERRKSLDKELWDLAKTIDDQNHIGTLYNEIGIPQGRCYAAGTLLGLDSLVEHLNDEGKPDLVKRDEENAHALRVQGTEHGNFAFSAEKMLELDNDVLART